MTRATADRYDLRKISDLRRTPQLRVVVDFSFLTRPDGWQGLVEKYDLAFRQAAAAGQSRTCSTGPWSRTRPTS